MSDNNKRETSASADEEQQEQPTLGATPERETQASAAEPKEKATVDIEALRQELEEQKDLAKHRLDQWKRAAADLENYRKRVQKEREEWVKFGLAALIGQLLPTLDDFERASQSLPAALSHLTWTQGVGLIGRKLRLALDQHGLKEITALGKPFDPTQHEAILQEENDACPDGQVLAVLQKGYMLHDRVLRPAMVKVAKNEGHRTAQAPTVAEDEKGPSATEEQDETESAK